MAGFWHTTCSSLQQGAEPSWAEVEDYRQPLMLLLRTRYARHFAGEIEDLVQDMLLEIKEKLFASYDRRRSRFRTFLCAVVQNKLLQRYNKARRHVPLGAQDEPIFSASEGESVDLIAKILRALRTWHDRHSQGEASELLKVYVLTGRLIRNQSYEQIATREGISKSSVKRILAQAREEILGDILQQTLHLPEECVEWKRLGLLVREVLKQPRKRREILQRLGQPRLREQLDGWLDVYETALKHMPAGSPAGQELRSGLRVIFGDP